MQVKNVSMANMKIIQYLILQSPITITCNNFKTFICGASMFLKKPENQISMLIS